MPRVSDIEIDQQGIVVNDVPINMVPPTEGKIKKKQLIAASESEEDLEADVQDITTFGKKRVGVRRVPTIMNQEATMSENDQLVIGRNNQDKHNKKNQCG
jgi:hypothetical protein